MGKVTESEGKLYFSYREQVTTPAGRYFDYIPEKELLGLFWKADAISFEDKQKIVTYLNARGHNLKLFRGEMRGVLHYPTEYFDGESWKDYKLAYDNTL